MSRPVRVTEVIDHLELLANRLDRMVDETRLGGWSTQNVAGMIEQANEARRMAARLRSYGVAS
jgi:hypothetical protein